MSRRAYFDWAASAPVHPAAREAALRALDSLGNPSSVHAEGRKARDLVEEARERVARLAGCAPREVIFTASGSEANALGIVGGYRAVGQTLPIALSAIEHPSALLAAKSIPDARIVLLPCDRMGLVDLERAAEALRDRTALLAVQLVNNEVGTLQPLERLVALGVEAGARIHCDAVQAAGKVDLSAAAGCHTLALSAHKLGGLPGAGALVARRGNEPLPVVPGHQEGGLRGGTHSVAAIAAFGAAAEVAASALEERRRLLEEKTDALRRLLREIAPDARIQGEGAPRVPGIVNVTFPSADGETLLVALDLAGVACSHGAACSTGAMEPSHVLLAMGLDAAEARSTLRFSLGAETGEDEIALLAAALPGALRASRLGA